jgi:hypothetical protein
MYWSSAGHSSIFIYISLVLVVTFYDPLKMGKLVGVGGIAFPLARSSMPDAGLGSRDLRVSTLALKSPFVQPGMVAHA